MSPNPKNYDPGPGQGYGLGPRLTKDDADDRQPIPSGGTEKRRPTPNASGDPEQERAESD